MRNGEGIALRESLGLLDDREIDGSNRKGAGYFTNGGMSYPPTAAGPEGREQPSGSGK